MVKAGKNWTEHQLKYLNYWCLANDVPQTSNPAYDSLLKADDPPAWLVQEAAVWEDTSYPSSKPLDCGVW